MHAHNDFFLVQEDERYTLSPGLAWLGENEFDLKLQPNLAENNPALRLISVNG